MKRLLPIILAVPLTLTACGSAEESADSTTPSSTQITSTTSATSTTATSSTSATSSASLTSQTPSPTLPVDAEDDDDLHVVPPQNIGQEKDPVIGYTEAPGETSPTPMNKTISTCGDPLLHERGTTFFTDGTSGWTQQCSNEMDVPVEPAQAPAPAPEYSGGDSRTCAEIGHKVYPGDPEYSPDRDSNGDGVGCESQPG